MHRSKSRAKNQAHQLGMSISTARSRLVKNLLFRSLVTDNKNLCFKCSLPIETVEDLSIEHILPWENRVDGESLYWDLENIAFSHIGCNRPHIQTGGRPRKVLDGKLYCPKCSEWKIPTLFHQALDRPCGRTTHCKECKSLFDTRKNHLKRGCDAERLGD